MGTSESNGEEGAALLCRWRGKLTDEELNGPGERACLRAPSGAPRARHIENSTGLRPHFFSTQPAGARAGAPEGGRAPRDHGAVRLWRGGDERLHRRFTLPVEFVIPLEIRSSIFHRLAIRPGRAHSISQQVLDV